MKDKQYPFSIETMKRADKAIRTLAPRHDRHVDKVETEHYIITLHNEDYDHFRLYNKTTKEAVYIHGSRISLLNIATTMYKMIVEQENKAWKE